MMRDFGAEAFDIVIQAGQSNSDGTGYGGAAEPFAPYGDIWHLENDGRACFVTPAREEVRGNDIHAHFGLTFAKAYIDAGRLGPGRRVLIVRSAVGGTGFSDGRWGPMDDLFLRMMDMTDTALRLNSANRAVALLWHQGETDAEHGAEEEYYFAHLSALVAAVRELCGAPGLPFVAGDFVRDWKLKHADICAPVIAATRRVCAEENARFAELGDLPSNNEVLHNGDDIHFSREAQYAIGQRYFKKWEEIAE
ncbi:MAG: sialate O-acetylesterase [Oscillospiraceae bacterium]|nr:sialate O-acetylesterase [Oscillospiraceae bacterium]